MNSTGLIVIALLMIASYFAIRWRVRVDSRNRITKLVTCPGTSRLTIVEVDATHSSLTLPVRNIRIKDCTRWPIQEHCGQKCLAHPDAHGFQAGRISF